MNKLIEPQKLNFHSFLLQPAGKDVAVTYLRFIQVNVTETNF